MTAKAEHQVEYQKVHVLGDNGAINTPEQIFMVESHGEDEISLIDLYLVLDRHKKSMAMIIAAVLLMGVFYAMSKPRVFNYSLSAQIGKVYVATAQGSVLEPIEPVEMVLSKITETYIPIVVSEYVAQNPDASVPEIKARIPKGSDIIILESRAPEGEQLQSTMMQQVLDKVVKSHRPYMDIMKSQFITQLNKAQLRLTELESPVTLRAKMVSFEAALLSSNIKKNKLADPLLIKVKKQVYKTKIQAHRNRLAFLQDESSYFSTELKRLGQLDKLLEQQITGLSSDIEQALKNRTVSADSVDNPSMAMTALLLNNQLQTDRRRLNDLQERLYIKQKNLREKLMNDIKNNTRSIEYEKTLVEDLKNSLSKLGVDDRNSLLELNSGISEKQAAIEKFKLSRQLQIDRQQQIVKDISLKLSGLQATEALSEPLKSIGPVGPGKKLIVMVSLVLGVFIAVFFAFGREFMLKVKQKSVKTEVEPET
ncbi:MAG TPA: hypothetical protein ENJ08_04210 [Gammaproteobacteria bacterium]|nr:hypothetical protein [Gammaproteobacteria bacterium]